MSVNNDYVFGHCSFRAPTNCYYAVCFRRAENLIIFRCPKTDSHWGSYEIYFQQYCHAMMITFFKFPKKYLVLVHTISNPINENLDNVHNPINISFLLNDHYCNTEHNHVHLA